MATEILSLEIKEDGSRVVSRKISDIGRKSIKAGNDVGELKRELKSISSAINPINALKSAVAGLGGAIALVSSFKESLAFGSSIDEVSTLVDEAKFNMEELTEEVKRQAIAFGSIPVTQTKALYQIISAGADNAADSIDTLTASNKLAVAGVTDVATAADGLTTVMNVYGEAAGSAADISDTLFIGMREGKTTIGELSSSIGKVIPFAEKLGVSFEEVVAATAALTKGGISTNESITGLRAILAAVAKPTSEAAALAEELGIEFNIAGLQSRKFGGFLEHLAEKTDGSTQSMTTLFGGVEALVPILGFAGQSGEFFNDIMERMDEKLGETDNGLRKITEGSGFKFRRFMALLSTVSIRVGDSLATVVIPVLDVLVDRFDDITIAAGSFIAVFSVAKIGAIITSVKSLASSVGLLTVAMAANPIGAIAVGISASIAALAFFSDDIKLGESGVVSLRDVAVASFDVIRERVISVSSVMSDQFKPAIDVVKIAFTLLSSHIGNVFDFTKDRINFAIGLYVGLAKTVIAAYETAIGYIKTLFGAELLGEISNFVTSVADNLSSSFDRLKLKVTEVLGLVQQAASETSDVTGIEPPDVKFESIYDDFAVGIRSIFEDSLSVDYIGGLRDDFNSLIDDVEKRAIDLKNTVTESSPVKEDVQSKVEVESSGRSPVDLAQLSAVSDEMRVQIQLLSMDADARSIASKQIQIQNVLREKGITLDKSEKEALRSIIDLVSKRAQLARSMDSVMRDLSGQQEDLNNKTLAYNVLLGEGVISISEYEKGIREVSDAQRELNFELGDASFVDGFILALDEMYDAVENFTGTAGAAFGDYFTTITDGFSDSAAKALLFGDSFKASFGNVARQALTQLTAGLIKLGVQFAITSLIGKTTEQAATAVSVADAAIIAAAWAPAAAEVSLASFGANSAPATAGIASTHAASRALSLPGLQHGGEFMVGGSGGTDSQIVAFRATPNEQVSVKTPAQQQKDGQGGAAAGNQPINVTVVNVVDENLVESYLSSAQGDEVLLNRITSNSGQITQILNSGRG